MKKSFNISSSKFDAVIFANVGENKKIGVLSVLIRCFVGWLSWQGMKQSTLKSSKDVTRRDYETSISNWRGWIFGFTFV